MEALRKILETKVVGHKWKYKRITHKNECPQSNEHIHCSQCGTMHRSSMTTPIVVHSLLLFVTNMFNTLLRLDNYK